ncbi:hypothetical protein ACET3Z_020180 [Daucus carota]
MATGGRNFQIQNLNFNSNRKWEIDDRRPLSRHETGWNTEGKHLNQFIWAHNHLVDTDILERLNIGDEKATAIALEQIHYRSLEGHRNLGGKQQHRNPEPSMTYREALNRHGNPGFSNTMNLNSGWTQSDNLGEFFNPLVCLDLISREQVSEDMIILYKGKQIQIFFQEITDLKYLQGKVLPMDFAEEDSSSEKMEQRFGKKRDSGVKNPLAKNKALVKFEEVDTKNFQDKSGVSQNSSPQEDVASDGIRSEYQETNNKLFDIRCRSGSSEVCSDGMSKFEDENRSEAGRQSTNLSSQSTLCSGITRKLKVKSNRGRPRKVTTKHRNPFEIGGGFKRRFKGRGKSKTLQKGRRSNPNTQCLQIVPSSIIGSSVKQALEILEAAENMGLAVNGDRDTVVKEIARQLEMNEL